MPSSERMETSDTEESESSAPPPRTSWAPPTGGIVRAKLLPDVGWEEYGTSNNLQIPVPSPHGFPGSPTRESMIPRAPLVPRMSYTPEPRVSTRTTTAPGTGARQSLPPPSGSRASIAPPTGARQSLSPPRMSMGPETRASMRPNDPWERMSLTPAVGMQSIAPGRFDDRGSEEDRRFTQALFLREQGRTEDALLILDDLARAFPEHGEARTLLLRLAIERQDQTRVEQHAEFVVQAAAQRGDITQVCGLYRTSRMAAPQMNWSERSLLAVLLAADRGGEGRVVVDVTKMLLHGYPQSPALPRALYASAAVQHNEGRPDLARATLQNLVTRFPRDSLAPIAKRRLNELT
jgi:hypothetical protein